MTNIYIIKNPKGVIIVIVMIEVEGRKPKVPNESFLKEWF
jgi:hypothetical protein